MFKFSQVTETVTNVIFESFATVEIHDCNNSNHSFLEALTISDILAAEVGASLFPSGGFGEDIHVSGSSGISVVWR